MPEPHIRRNNPGYFRSDRTKIRSLYLDHGPVLGGFIHRLAMEANGNRPIQATIGDLAEELGGSVKWVRNRLGEAEQAGLIKWDRGRNRHDSGAIWVFVDLEGGRPSAPEGAQYNEQDAPSAPLARPYRALSAPSGARYDPADQGTLAPIEKSEERREKEAPESRPHPPPFEANSDVVDVATKVAQYVFARTDDLGFKTTTPKAINGIANVIGYVTALDGDDRYVWPDHFDDCRTFTAFKRDALASVGLEAAEGPDGYEVWERWGSRESWADRDETEERSVLTELRRQCSWEDYDDEPF